MEFKLKILVVEDDLSTLSLMGKMLTRLGAEPHCMASSRQAAERIDQEKFDGIFLDWMMPEMDGLQLAERIRQSKPNSQSPIVMLTCNTSRTAMQESFRRGINLFLQKPVTMQQIRHLINSGRSLMLQMRRNYQRMPVESTVLCKWNQGRIVGQSVNISTSGMLVELKPAPPLKTEVRLEFSLPGDSKPFRLTARVSRVSPKRHVGFRFVDLSPAVRKRLLELVEALMRPLAFSKSIRPSMLANSRRVRLLSASKSQ